MKPGFRYLLLTILALLIFFQEVAPSFALPSADVSVRCARQPASAAPCARATLTAAQATLSGIMSAMPCCRAMAREIAQAAAAKASSDSSSEQTLSNRDCIVTIRWSSVAISAAALTAAPFHSRWQVAAATLCLLALPPFIAHATLFIADDSAAIAYATDPGPPLASRRHFLSHGLRAPPSV